MEKITVEQVKFIVETRINDLAKFKDVDLTKIKGYQERTIAAFSQKTLELNERLLRIFSALQ